ANEPAVIGMRSDRAERAAVAVGVEKVDLIKAGLGVAAIPVREHIRCDQIADPSTDGPSRFFFRLTNTAVEGFLKIPMQVHEVIRGEGADDPIAQNPAAGAELIVTPAADSAEPTAAARGGSG